MRKPQNRRLGRCWMISVILLCILIIPALSQQTDDLRVQIVAEEAQQFKTQSAYLNHKSGYIDKAETMNIVPVIANNWYRSKVNITRHREFKGIGIDLQQIASYTNHITDYEYHTLFSDVIVKGTVINKVYEKSRTSYWHTMHTIQVAEILKGNTYLDSVKTYQISGYIEDMPARLSLDQLHSIGDEGIFYLNYWKAKDIADLQEELSAGYGLNGATEANIVDDGESFGVTLFQPIREGYIYTEESKEGTTGKVTSRIRSILDVNNSTDFYSTNFRNKR